MKKRLLEFLRCPDCRSSLKLSAEVAISEVQTGRLICECGKEYPIRGGIPRFVENATYTKNFSFEWKMHNKTQLDTETENVSESDFRKKTGLKQSDVKGKLVLDAGCGMGRFADVIQKWGAEVIGVDLSFAVDSAYENLGGKPNVHIIQADIFNLPFKKEIFDIIYSIGVLHHTPNCKEAFLCLPQFLKHEGYLSIWVYSNYNKAHSYMSAKIRAVTTRIPQRLLYALCFLSVPLYYIYKIPIIGHLLRNLFPISMQRKCNWRILDTFDWYSPKHQSKHRYPEVCAWFKEAGLQNIGLYEPPVAVGGRKA